MHCVLHLGIEKTGSSAIQAALGSNRACLEQAGFQVGWPTSYGNSRFLVAAFQEAPDDYWKVRCWESERDRTRGVKADLQWLEEAIRKSSDRIDTVILSSEHFHSRLRDEVEIARLRNYLYRLFDKVTLVFYLRPQGSARTSLYSTALRVGFTHSFRRFSANVGKDESYFDYAELLEKWQRAFRQGAMVVRPYWPTGAQEFDVRKDFFSILGVDTTLACLKFSDARENSSLSWPQLWVMRAVNILTRPSRDSGFESELRERLAQRIEFSRLLSFGPRPRDNDPGFTRHFQHSNAHVSEKYGIPHTFWDHS